MKPRHVASTALALTLLTVLLVDGGLLWGCIALVGMGDGPIAFLASGGPITLICSGMLHAWFKRRLSNGGGA